MPYPHCPFLNACMDKGHRRPASREDLSGLWRKIKQLNFKMWKNNFQAVTILKVINLLSGGAKWLGYKKVNVRRKKASCFQAFAPHA